SKINTYLTIPDGQFNIKVNFVIDRHPPRSGCGGNDAIPPAGLGFIEGHVGALYQSPDGIFTLAPCSHSQTGCDRNRWAALPNVERAFRDLPPDALSDLLGDGKFGLRHDDDELLATIAADKIDPAQVPAQPAGELLEHRVSRVMPQGI